MTKKKEKKAKDPQPERRNPDQDEAMGQAFVDNMLPSKNRRISSEAVEEAIVIAPVIDQVVAAQPDPVVKSKWERFKEVLGGF